MSRIKDWLFPPVHVGPDVRRDMRVMLPGMLIEQVAATLLDNINIVVMGFIGNEATAGVSQVSTINNTMMIVVQFFAMGGTALVAQAAPHVVGVRHANAEEVRLARPHVHAQRGEDVKHLGEEAPRLSLRRQARATHVREGASRATPSRWVPCLALPPRCCSFCCASRL